MKKAIIIGCQGQDGRLLYDLLLQKKYILLGIDQNFVHNDGFVWDKPIDITNTQQVAEVIKQFVPDEIYYLAAFHHSSEDALLDNVALFEQSYNINVFAPFNFLEGMRRYSIQTRFFYAASSHIFGKPSDNYQNEGSRIDPIYIYGISKATGYHVCRFYRCKYSVFTSTGILYNHESSIRNEKFVSMKIIKGAVNIKNGRQNKLILGDLSAVVDWGYAPDYVDAMHRILNIGKADDFVIATEKKHTVRDFVQTAFGFLGLDWNHYVEEKSNIITKEKAALVGDPKKLKTMTGWKPSVDFKQMIKLLLFAEGAEIEQ